MSRKADDGLTSQEAGRLLAKAALRAAKSTPGLPKSLYPLSHKWDLPPVANFPLFDSTDSPDPAEDDCPPVADPPLFDTDRPTPDPTPEEFSLDIIFNSDDKRPFRVTGLSPQPARARLDVNLADDLVRWCEAVKENPKIAPFDWPRYKIPTNAKGRPLARTFRRFVARLGFVRRAYLIDGAPQKARRLLIKRFPTPYGKRED